MKLINLFVIMISIFCGCSSSYDLRSPLEANHRPITDRAEIMLRSGKSISAANIEVGQDTTRFILVDSDSIGQIDTKMIDQLLVTDYMRGTVGGFLAGGVGGFFAGILTGRISGIPSRGESALGLLVYGAGGMAFGSISGALYWGTRGYRNHYIFPRDTP
jgi:hypothetical protein